MPDPMFYRVVNITKRVILDPMGSPKNGYHIEFITVSGYLGFVDISEDRFTDQLAKETLLTEVKRLEGLGKLG